MLPKCDAVRSPLATALHATQPDKYALPAWAYTGYTASFLYPFASYESVGVAKCGDLFASYESVEVAKGGD